MTLPPVPLIRRFTPILKAYEQHDLSLEDLWPSLDRSKELGWHDLHAEYRVAIIADAGAGKTFELKAEAERLLAKGQAAFFIRIEDIDATFEKAFEVGSPDAFEAWLSGPSEAWFFLDSVDEVRLSETRAFEKAIRTFAARIRSALQRAHVYISGRPYAWRMKLDRALIDEVLPFSPPQSEKVGEEKQTNADAELEEDVEPKEKEGSPLSLYRLAPLDADDIRIFGGHRGLDDVENLLNALERSLLLPLAQLPFDLEDILATWIEKKALDSRLAVLQSGIRRCLAKPDTVFGKQLLPIDQALDGAQRLAMAAMLTGEANIRLAGGSAVGGVDPVVLLPDWSHEELIALLGRGIFSDPIYGTVRFRHREIRELLAAEGFAKRLLVPTARGAVEELIFRKQYGEAVIVPRLRPLLPWLVLFDEGVRTRALAIHPGIATEGGDAAQLPLHERQKILAGIVAGIADKSNRGGDNSEIARIAQVDLADDTLGLIETHFENDDIIFFLGRLAWQGKMRAAAERLGAVAANPKRGIYARMVSARALAEVRGEDARRQLWQTLNGAAETLPRRLLAELVEGAASDDETIKLVLTSIEKLEPYIKYETTGLSQALHRLIDRFPVFGARVALQPLAALATGLTGLLRREPHIERGECGVSQTYRWLAPHAAHVVERLIVGRADACLQDPAMWIMTQLPALWFWGGREDGEHRSKLIEVIPRWIELNDALYWRAVAERRLSSASKGERLVDDWPVMAHGHLWAFGAESFGRAKTWIGSRALKDDRQVALALVFRIYAQNGRPRRWLEQIKKLVAVDAELEAQLAQLRSPLKSAGEKRWRERERQYQLRRRRSAATQARNRAEFAARLAANPEVVRVPQGLAPDQLSNSQYHLLRILEGEGMRTSRRGGADWLALIPEFGQQVAEAYRDGAQRLWRSFRPGLRSEGADTSSIPYALIYALAGLEIEAGDDGAGFAKLSEDEIRQAMRYVFSELNGFPRWFEPLYRAFPQIGRAVIWQEVLWELENSPAGQSLHYVLHDIIYHASWLHAEMAQAIWRWLANHDAPNTECLRCCRQIMASGGVEPGALDALARSKVTADKTPSGQLPGWLALWVDTDPDAGIPALEVKLASLEASAATEFAESFVVALLGGRRESGSPIGVFRTPEHLKSLYLLMHQQIRVSEDLQRVGKGVYAPVQRDDAQDARSRLFSILADIPGEAAYKAISALASDHPETEYRPYMRVKAYDRAVADADLAPWTSNQVRVFEDHIAAGV